MRSTCGKIIQLLLMVKFIIIKFNKELKNNGLSLKLNQIQR